MSILPYCYCNKDMLKYTLMNVQSVIDIFEEQLESRIVSSNLQMCNIDSLVQTVENWKKDGYKIVFTAGVFDIFTINHLLALYHYRLIGGDKVKLVISIDTDERVKQSKSFVKEKSKTIKPILSWDSRALMIAKQSFRNTDALVDMIVQHGSDTCSSMRCPHDDNTTIAEMIIPDVIVVTSTSTDTVDKIKKSTVLMADTLRIIEEEELAYQDSLIGGKISSTSIIKRVKYGS